MTQGSAEFNKVMDKIKKLLALATSDNPAEAQSALNKAQELQAKYNIQFVNEEEKMQVINIRIKNEDTETMHPNFAKLAGYMADHYRVCVYINRSWDSKMEKRTTGLQVMGLQKDIDVFVEVLKYAYRVMVKCAASFVRSLDKALSSTAKTALKNDYIRGFMQGVDSGLTENETQFALVVVKPKEVEKEYSKLHLGRAKSTSITAHSSTAKNRGWEDGKNTMTNKRRYLDN